MWETLQKKEEILDVTSSKTNKKSKKSTSTANKVQQMVHFKFSLKSNIISKVRETFSIIATKKKVILIERQAHVF